MNQKWNKPAGFTLLEVVLAIAVFALGMLALVELQTGLARSGSDANLRTTAMHIAERMVEERRGYTDIDAYTAITSFDDPEPFYVGEIGSEFGAEYTTNLIVQDYYWDADTETFVTTAPEGIVVSDYKTLDIVVMWRPLDTDVESLENHDTICFGARNAEGSACTDEFDEPLYGGGVRIVQALTSQPPRLGALIASSREEAGNPQVDYNPGDNPDIIRITLDGDGGKFKESTTATPDVIRDDKVETWFDVVTYSQLADAEAIYLRREEFVAITCDCELDTAPEAAADYGLKPTLWNGVDYSEGEKVFKPIGLPVGAASQQSQFCGVCCRDHHNGAGAGAEDVYRREDVGSDTDHLHYGRDRRGDLVLAGDGDEYVEACRLIRKDGFMRVTQDANQNALIGFPEGYIDFDEGVLAYSDYLTESAADYYTTDQVTFPQPNPPDDTSPHVFPARTMADATDLPTVLGASSQQLRVRGVYTDYLTDAAQDVIDECFPLEDRTDDCIAPNTSTALEIYPFFELQLTKLARWNDASVGGVVSVTNEPVQSGNTHSRGLLELISGDEGQSRIEIDSHKDNLGLTATGAIDLLYDARTTTDSLYVDANGDDTPVPPIGTVVSGELRSSLRRVPTSDLLLKPTGDTMCGQTDTDWTCVMTGDAQLSVGNYFLNMPRTYACSELTFVSESVGPPAASHFTIFDLPLSGTYDIWITDELDACDR